MTTSEQSISESTMERIRTLARDLSIPEDELVKRSLDVYLITMKDRQEFNPIGEGMWSDREDIEDSATTARKWRESAWNGRVS